MQILEEYKKEKEKKFHQIIDLKKLEDIIAEKYAKYEGGDTINQFTDRYIALLNDTIETPKRYNLAFPGDMIQEVKLWAQQYDGHTGLYLYGEAGTGKTHSIYALAKLLRANQIEVKIKNVPDWLDHLRTYFKEEAVGSISTEFENYDNKVLILDDFGAEKQSEWTTEIMYRFVNARYEQAKPTIFSSNLDVEQLSEKYGDRIASRIVEMVGNKNGIIKTKGEDKRIIK